ncbi:MAG: spheroidene monooxygenase [Actinomycetota bacterium]
MSTASSGAITQTHCKAEMSAVATFHVLKWRNIVGMVSALAFDRLRYRRVAGLRFLRVLGTGKGSSTAPGTQFGRTALFCLFADESSADQFVARLSRRRGTREMWHVKLRGAGGHGSWRGTNIPQLLGGIESSQSETAPLAIITRADVRARSWRTFARAARVVDDELHRSDGLLAVIGIGEAPILRLGTFSLWRNVNAMYGFAHRQPEHEQVVRRTRSERWYGEEMFARFAPYWSAGTWDGRDPLRDIVSQGNNIP